MGAVEASRFDYALGNFAHVKSNASRGGLIDQNAAELFGDTLGSETRGAIGTNEVELEEQMAADAVDEEGAQVKKKVRFAKPVSNVRWSTVRRRRTMPGSEGWSWGGKRDDSTEWFRAQYLERRSDERVGSWAWPVQ